jgi:EpsI family protein
MNGNAANNKRALMIAVGAALGLLIVSGVGYRVLAWRLGATDGGTPLPPGALQRLSMKIGDWVGQDVKLDERIVEATDTDAHVNRRYVKRNSAEGVSLYIAYGVRARDLMPHRPEVCYPGNGWTMQDTRHIDLPLPDGTKLKCRILKFSRAGLSTENITVLSYYLVDGEYSSDVSLLRSKAWAGQGGIGYMAQVQVTCPGRGQLSPESSVKSVSAFAADSARGIYELFQHSGEDADKADTQPRSMPVSGGNSND